MSRFAGPVKALSQIVIGLVLLLRVSALYDHNKVILSFLTCLFTCQLAAVIVARVVDEKDMTPILYYESLPGCWYNVTESKSAALWRDASWIPFMCVDGILLVLTFAKAFSYRDHPNPTIKLLARDSLLYFIPMFASMVWDIVPIPSANLGFQIIQPEWIACIAVSRMMLSIRSLVCNNPLSTQRTILSTIAFRHDRVEEADNPENADITDEPHSIGV